MRKPATTAAAAPGSAPALTIVLKSLRNPPLEMTLPAQPLATSVLELKQAVAAHAGLPGAEKIRLLYKKKPCTDSKTVKELLGDEMAKEIEFSVMIMGGGLSVEQGGGAEVADGTGAHDDGGMAVMQTPEFWRDLEGFLEQRVKSQEVARTAAQMFEEVWRRKP